MNYYAMYLGVELVIYIIMDKKQIYWRLRRGVLELDFIFQDFWQQHYDNLLDDDKKAFIALLDLQDPKLLQYLVYRSDTPDDPDISRIVAIILAKIDKKIT